MLEIQQPRKLAFVFPGQGAQYVGMGRNLFGHPLIRRTYEEAGDILGKDIRSLSFEDPNQELTGPNSKTSTIQACLTTLSVGIGRLLALEGVQPYVRAGLSAGKPNALVDGEAIEFAEGLRLSYRRGELMERTIVSAQQANRPFGVGVIKGLDLSLIEQKLKELGETVSSVKVTIKNPGSIFLVGGIRDQVRTFIASFNDERRASEYPEAPLSHHALMQEAEANFWEVVERVKSLFRMPKSVILNDVDGQPFQTREQIEYSLKFHIANPLDCAGWVDYFKAHQLTDLAEIGPGKTLSTMIKKEIRSLRGHTANTIEEVYRLIELLQPPNLATI